MQRVLVSRCLLGERVRYDGAASEAYPLLAAWAAEGRVVPVCPEVEGGLPTPRPRAEIPGGQGAAVLDGRLPVVTVDGGDVTAEYRSGAERCLDLVARHGIRIAVLKAKSPSCGNEYAYDGSFGGTLVPGEGVAAAALRRAGVRVFNEGQLGEAQRALADLDAGSC